jgi:CheY-like chemotaxis protein
MQAELLRAEVSSKRKVKQVLYIDDEPSISLLVEYSLDLFTNWHITTATGRQAVEIAKTRNWDVLLLEIALSSEAGLTVYQQLTADSSIQATPLILFTSKVMPADFRTYKQMTIAGVITKPFDPMTLGSQIANLLGWTT